MLVVTIDPGTGVIYMLPLAADQTSLIDGLFLLMPLFF